MPSVVIKRYCYSSRLRLCVLHCIIHLFNKSEHYSRTWALPWDISRSLRAVKHQY